MENGDKCAIGVKDVVRPRVKFNDEPNGEQGPDAQPAFMRLEEQRLRHLSEAVWRFKEWEDHHILGKTHPGGFGFGADSTEAFSHRSSLSGPTTKRQSKLEV